MSLSRSCSSLKLTIVSLDAERAGLSATSEFLAVVLSVAFTGICTHVALLIAQSSLLFYVLPI